MLGSIPGDVPALAGIEGTTAQSLPFAMFAWQQTPGASSLSGTPTPRPAFTVFNGNDDVAAARAGWTFVDSTRNLISTTFVSVSATASGTTYTYTSSSAHGLSSGQTVTVTGMTPTAYNLTGTVTVTSSTQFTMVGSTSNPTASTVSGTAIRGALSSITFSAEYPLDPSLLPIDAYADGDRAIEVWALLRTDSSSKLALPTIVASLKAAAGGGVIRYTDEWGSAGRIVPTASSATSSPVLRWTRLGTLHLPAAGSREMRLVLAGSVATGSASGVFGIARVMLVPVRQRAATPTTKANDSTYPAWSTSATETVKYVDSDLSATSYQPASSLVALGDRSFGGSPLEISPGLTSLGVILAANVPDSPTADSTTEYLGTATPPSATSQPQATVHVSVTPRFAYLR
jgi:hypothetical protein